jgi:acyl carrier protein
MTSYEETLKIATEVLMKHVELDRAIKPTDHIQNDLGLDSLGVMEVVADMEDRLNVSIPTEKLDGLATVEDVTRVLMSLKT